MSPVLNFEFATAGRILFGAGKRNEAVAFVRTLGKRTLIVTGQDSTRSRWLQTSLAAAGVEVVVFPIGGEPKLDDIGRGAAAAREAQADSVIAIGGGSALDGGKAIAALARNQLPLVDYLEVIGAGRALECDPLPVIAIPTTAGTGSEVTRNAVLTSPGHKLKVSLRSPRMLPSLAIIDPQLTHGLPATLTASTGLDALTQLIEPFLCSRANPMTDGLCREALPRVARSLPVAFRTEDQNARSDMALGSLFGGLALANSGLGAVHGFAAPIGGMFSAPHGSICATLLPHVMRVNFEALKERNPISPILDRFDELAFLLAQPQAEAELAIEFVEDLCEELNIPKLSNFGIGPEHFDDLCERAANSSSMKANPIQLTSAELREVLNRAA